MEYSRIKTKKIRVHKRNCHSQPLQRASRSGDSGAGEGLENVSKELNIFLALTHVETALANGGGLYI